MRGRKIVGRRAASIYGRSTPGDRDLPTPLICMVLHIQYISLILRLRRRREECTLASFSGHVGGEKARSYIYLTHMLTASLLVGVEVKVLQLA